MIITERAQDLTQPSCSPPSGLHLFFACWSDFHTSAAAVSVDVSTSTREHDFGRALSDTSIGRVPGIHDRLD